MLVVGFPAGPWGTNCYVVASGAGEQCVVVDPGKDAAPGVEEAVREHGLQPVAVLLTHGHIDHVWSVAPVCGDYGVPATCTRPTGRCSPTRSAASAGRPARCSSR